jgi:hypothetical protein
MSNFKKEDINKVKDLVILADTEGGKVLIKTLTDDIISDIDRFVNYRSALSQFEFNSLACDIKAKLDVVRVLKRAQNNEKFLKELLEDTLTA